MNEVRQPVIALVSSIPALNMAIILFARCQVSAFYRDGEAECGLESVGVEIVIACQICEIET